MSRLTEFVLAIAIASSAGAAFAQSYAKVGRSATPQEIAAWDTDVRADFKGLPPGSGSVAHGQRLWDAKCASCHGTFGESNEVFTPLAGGTTREDMKSGHVAALANNSQPQRTTLMKLATVSTLWDYINRAMPWTAPKSLSIDEVYAVTAYILNLGQIVPDDFTLSDKNIAAVQKTLPNREGMTQAHGLWKVANRTCRMSPA
jgi:cytochrome c